MELYWSSSGLTAISAIVASFSSAKIELGGSSVAVRAGVQLGVSVARSLSAKEPYLSEGGMALVTEVHLFIPRGELDVPPPKIEQGLAACGALSSIYGG